MSKQLDSILSTIPSATANGELQRKVLKEEKQSPITSVLNRIECDEKISARIPNKLKQEIREYIKNHKGDTEQTVIFKALRLMGFDVDQSLLVDKRTLR